MYLNFTNFVFTRSLDLNVYMVLRMTLLIIINLHFSATMLEYRGVTDFESWISIYGEILLLLVEAVGGGWCVEVCSSQLYLMVNYHQKSVRIQIQPPLAIASNTNK